MISTAAVFACITRCYLTECAFVSSQRWRDVICVQGSTERNELCIRAALQRCRNVVTETGLQPLRRFALPHAPARSPNVTSHEKQKTPPPSASGPKQSALCGCDEFETLAT